MHGSLFFSENTVVFCILECYMHGIPCSDERIPALNLQVKLYQQSTNTKYVIAYKEKSPIELVFKPLRSVDYDSNIQ